MKKIMAVYDVEAEYAERFADYANQNSKTHFAVVAFTGIEPLINYAKEHTISILLVSDKAEKTLLDDISAEQIFVLSGGEVIEKTAKYPTIYKYQASDNVLREVMSYYSDTTEAEKNIVRSKAKIFLIYSPVNRCAKTSFALVFGQLMSKERKVLYINLEEFSGFSKLSNTEYKTDLSDVLYCYTQENFNWMKLNSMTYTWGSFDYIPPVRYADDLKEFAGKEMAQFIEEAAKHSGYETIIVDAGNMGKQIFPFMDIANMVYMPVKGDPVSLAKIENFEETLGLMGREHLTEKVKKLSLPVSQITGKQGNYLDQLMWSELGDYIRRMLLT